MNWTIDHKILVQGLNYPDFVSSLKIMQDSGTNIVAGISAGHSGKNNYDFPIFDLVEQAIAEFGPIQTSLIFNHPYEVLDAVAEAIASGIKQIIINSTRIPPLDLLQILRKAEAKNVKLLGPSNAGMIVPNKLCLGLMETKFYHPGEIAVINTGDWSLNYEVALSLNKENLGQSIALNLGNDALLVSSIFSWLKMLESHQETSAIVLIISDEKYLNKQELKEISKNISSPLKKPIIVYFPHHYSPSLLTSKNANKMIVEQGPLLFDNVASTEEIIEALTEAKFAIASSLKQVVELTKNNLIKT
jgi:succinyl-CoA synthetase alpha subunit